MEDFLRIGVITSPHGVRGEVKVYPTTDSAERFAELKKLYVGNEKREAGIQSVKFNKQMVILKLDLIPDRNAAETMRNIELFIDREAALPLAEDEYYIADLIGMEVFDENGSVVGTLTDVLETGANDVYVISGEREILIPAIKQCILSTDINAKRMVVKLLPGLAD